MVRGIQRIARLLKSTFFGRRPTPSSASLRLSALIAAAAFGSAMSGQSGAQPPAPAQLPWLDQGWTPAIRASFHHQSQGTLTLPIPRSWFLALQQPGLSPASGMFSDPAYLDRFGFIPSPRDGAINPDGLPVGFARTSGTDPRTGQPLDRLGFTCAACHTGRIDIGTVSVFIDGGPALIDLGAFGEQLGLALGETDIAITRFRRFANRVLGPNHTLQQELQLHSALHRLVVQGLGTVLQGLGQGGVKEGFGRLDALNRIGNTVFADDLGLPQNNVPVTAPVAYPHIWDVSWFAWVQYNGSIQQPMVRNAGEAMGVSAGVNFNQGPTPQFTSTIPVGALHTQIEAMLAGPRPPAEPDGFTGLRAPRWPVALLPWGPDHDALAARGADLYRQRCQGCHLPAPDTPEFWRSDRWSEVNQAGERYLDLKMIPISTIGTDSAQAGGMANRTVLAPPSLGLTGETGASGTLRRYPYGSALGQVVERVVTRWYDTNNVTPAERERMNGFRPNGIRAPLAYKARPLNGIWATSPYLHNGSVLTLWELLSPYAERRSSFSLGGRRFDPVRVGYMDGGPFRLDTSRPGNRNTGHLFETPVDPARRRQGTIGPALSPDERQALIEYLKTL